MSIFDQIQQYGFMPVITIHAPTIDFAAGIPSAR